VIADDLTGQAHAGQALGRKHRALGIPHGVGFARDEFHAARRAARATATRMQLVNAGILLQRQHKALAGFHFKRSHTFDGQLRHL
jgi:hypothetical protein